MKTILFLCVHNAGRSQMAQAFFNKLNNNPEFNAESAGTDPADKVNPVAVKAMKELLINMSDKIKYYPKQFDKHKKYFKIYSMGCSDECISFSDEDLGIKDPAGKSIKEVREIRDKINKEVIKIIESIDYLA